MLSRRVRACVDAAQRVTHSSIKTCDEVGRHCLRPRPILTGTLAEKSWFDRSWRVGEVRAPLADSALNSCCLMGSIFSKREP